MRTPIPYLPTCIALGAILGWLPVWLHGPIAERFNVHYIQGVVAVWAFYSARMLVGTWVGLTSWPARWWLRGPLCGFLSLLPVTFIPLAMPECGSPCMAYNLTTGSLIGLAVAGLARAITGLDHR